MVKGVLRGKRNLPNGECAWGGGILNRKFLPQSRQGRKGNAKGIGQIGFMSQWWLKFSGIFSANLGDLCGFAVKSIFYGECAWFGISGAISTETLRLA
jgi:hypothetical protein